MQVRAVAMLEDQPIGPQDDVVGIGDAPWVLVAPRALFSRVQETTAYGWTLVVLVGLVTLIGYAQMQTGLIDRVVDFQTQQSLAQTEKTQAGLISRIELSEKMEQIREQGQFTKLLTRLGAMVFTPVYMLASFLVISAILYAAVALTGRTPQYHILMAICVYAGFIELVGLVLRLAMMIYYRTIAVDTSLGMLVSPEKSPALFVVLSAINPFQLWFWGLIGIGLVVTDQLKRRGAAVWCSILCLAGMGMRAAMAMTQT